MLQGLGARIPNILSAQLYIYMLSRNYMYGIKVKTSGSIYLVLDLSIAIGITQLGQCQSATVSTVYFNVYM